MNSFARIRVVLHRTSHPGNIGSAARAMKTMGLSRLVLVAPRRELDEEARALYDGLVTKGQAIQQKQQLSMPVSGEEVADFEQHRTALFNNPIAQGFLDAQEQLHKVQESVQQYVSKTLELGRLPTDEEMSGGSCGHGCGCSH